MRSGEDASLGTLLRRYRMAATLTQEELAAQAGLSVRTISCIENGRTIKPYRRSVGMLADALALPAAERAAPLSAVRGAQMWL